MLRQVICVLLETNNQTNTYKSPTKEMPFLQLIGYALWVGTSPDHLLQSAASDNSVLVALGQCHCWNAEMARAQPWKYWASSFSFDLNVRRKHTAPSRIWPGISRYWLIFSDYLSGLSFYSLLFFCLSFFHFFSSRQVFVYVFNFAKAN